MSFFNKISDVLILDAVKNVFQRRISEVLLPDILEFRSICFTVNETSPVRFINVYLIEVFA